MEKQKKKLTISGKSKKTFISKQNFESKKKISFHDKKFSRPLNKTPNNFKLKYGDFFSYKNQLRLKDYMTNIVYEKPYSNNPSFFKLAYIIRVK